MAGAGAGPVRLSFSAFGGRLQCAVARETLSHKAYLPFDEARVMAASRELIAVLTRGNRGRKLTEACLHDLRTIGEEMYRALIPEQVREDLADAQGPVLLELDENLVAVPWELLHDGQRFLCRRFDLGRAVATPQPRRAQGARRMGRPARVLVLCSDPRGDLAAVHDEGQEILDELDPHPDVKVRVLAGKGVEEVRKIIKDYDVVHFAGHADYDRGDPEASGWHLADGKLAARDVAALAGGRPMPLLVFSNACQSSHEGGGWTGEDPGRVFGLANAFLLSGVKFYLGTQWEIVDGQSHRFARAFYAELARGRSVGAAVRRAREAVIVAEGEGGLGWAGYVLYGDPAFVPLGAADPLRASQPQLPTPADIVSRESIRGVVKVKKNPSGEHVLAPTRGGLVVEVSAAKTATPGPSPVSHAVPPTASLKGGFGVWLFLTVFVVSVTAVVLALLLTR